MTSIGSPSPFFLAGKKAYEVERSLRFNDNDSAYLSRTPSSSSNRRTWTFSAWVKRSNTTTGAFQTLFAANNSSNYGLYGTYIWFTTIDTLAISINSGIYYLQTNAVFRDVSAWYHLVVNIDTTQATSSNRMKIYVNGVEETSFATTTYPTQNLDSSVNLNQQHTVGARRYSSIDNYFDGYIAEVNFIDGFQYDPSYFGETDSLTGQWIPKKYTGSYGTNGFYLNFSDNSGTSSTTLGKDSSGNGNNFTPNNFVTGDVVKDTPTNNFCTLNPIGNNSGGSFSNGSLQRNVTASVDSKVEGTFAVSSGKWYWEVNVISGSGNFAMIGIKDISIAGHENDFWNNNAVYAYYGASGEKYNSGSNTTYGATYTNGDIIGVALDLDAGTLIFYKNNTSQGTAFSSLTGTYNAYVGTGLNAFVCVFNFGQDSTFAGNETAQGNTDGSGEGDFYYAPPSGYKALCSANLPDPTILLPNKHFDTITWSGNNTSGRTLTGVGFSPDWTWLKCRSTATNHHLYDIVRGANKILHSDSTDAEDSSDQYGYLSAFTSDGFTLTNGSNASYPAGSVNMTGRTYVGWNWNAGDTDGKTYTVTVVSDSGNKYRFDGYGTSAVTLDLAEGGTYIFDQSDSSNAGHPLRFYTAADKTGGEYTTGVTTVGTPGSSGAYTQIVVAASAPTLYYQCSVHAGMGGQANTNSTLGSSNFDGSIQSTVKVNATAGFSIVTYTGTGADGTVGHGLGVTPDVVIVKNRDSGQHWSVKHKDLTSGYNVKLNLNEAQGQSTGSTNGIIADLSSSSNFSLTRTGNTGNYKNVNLSGEKHVAYCLSGVTGYSKFGLYTGNGSSNGTFVFTGFRPAWVMIKRTNSADNWVIDDTARSPFNEMNNTLYANLTNAEYTGGLYGIDFLSNGFKIRDNDGNYNANNNTYIYFAFAESPFKNARAR